MGKQIGVLDGGIAAWRSAGKPTTATATPTAARGTWTPRPREEAIISAAGLRDHLGHEGVVVLDARKPDEYIGAAAEDGVARGGHIPTAKNLDWTLTMNDGAFKPAAEIRRLFADQGVKPGDRVVTYCRVGTRASVLYFAAKMLGYDAVMYDGSMVDWSRRTELPVVKGPNPGQ